MDSDRPSPLEPGYRIDRYELLYALAEGGMGTVWVARLQGKHGFEKLFAVKTILPRYAADSSFRAMFLDEARIASAIDHPNVAQILDLAEQHGMLYQIMEYVEGESVQRLLRIAEKNGEKMPRGVAMRIVADTCAGLHAAHELVDELGRPRDVVHRDVTPHNVLVSLAGVAKLIDFGIAKARGRLAGETSHGVLKGKIRYTPPEQAFGQGIDRRADVWAVAAMLRVMLTGEPPYHGDGEMDLLRALLSKDPPTPLPADMPAPIARVLDRALQPDPANRYPTAVALQDAIEHAMAELGTPCTTANVGAWVRERTMTRMQGRRESLDMAVRAIEECARLRSALDKPLLEMASVSSASSIAKAAVELLSQQRKDPEPAHEAVRTTASVAEANESTRNAATVTVSVAGVPKPLAKSKLAVIGGTLAVVLLGSAVALLVYSKADVRQAGAAERELAPVPARSNAIPPPDLPAPDVPVASVATPTPTSERSAVPTDSARPTQAPRASDKRGSVLGSTRPASASATRSPVLRPTHNGDDLGGTIDSRQ